jgi:hypothetical protein
MHDAVLIHPDLDDSNLVYESDLLRVDSLLESTENYWTTQQQVDLISQKDIVVSGIEELASLDDSSDGRNIDLLFVASDRPSQLLLYESESKYVKRNESNSFLFGIQNNTMSATKFTELTITVVFRGDFVGSQYVAGDISVNIKQISEADKNSSFSTVDRIQDYEVIKVQNNSKPQMGVILITLGCKDTTINSGLYEITVTAIENIYFSIMMRGSSAMAAFSKIKLELARIIYNQREARQSYNLASALEPTIHLLERKFTLEENLLHQARVKSDQCEFQIEELELQLDERDEMQDDGAFVLKRMQILEEEYKHWRLVLNGR